MSQSDVDLKGGEVKQPVSPVPSVSLSQAGKPESLVCKGHTRPVPNVHFSALLPGESSNGLAAMPYFFISSCKDGKPMIRDWVGDWIGTFIGHKGAVWDSKLVADGTMAVTGSADFTARVWDSTDGSCKAVLECGHIVRGVDIDNSKSFALTGDQNGFIRMWDISTKQQIWSKCVGEGVRTVAFTTDPKIVVASTEKRLIWLDRTEGGNIIQDDKLDGMITSMHYSYGSQKLTVSAGNKVLLYDVMEKKLERTIELEYPPSSVSFHPNQTSVFVTGSKLDQWVRLHDAKTGTLIDTNKGHHGPVHSVAFSPDGEMYASSSEDGTIRLWQVEAKEYGLWGFAQ